MRFSKKDILIETKKRDYAWSMPKFHCHDLYEVYYLASGKRTILSEQKIYDLSKGDMMLFRPNVLHKGAGTDSQEKLGIEFSKKFLDYHFTAAVQDKILHCFTYNFLHLDENEQLEFERLYKKLCGEYATDRLYAITIAEILLFLDGIGERHENTMHRPQHEFSKSSEKINNILTYIEENFAHIRSMDQIAQNAYIDKSYMCRIFKKKTNMTVMDYLYNYRIQQACEMLTSTDKTISAVAEACGFENVSHFIKMFKTMLSCTPGQFRRLRK